jgi:hypothetical protein
MELAREEIIKALECCSNRVKANCDECPIGEKRSCAIELYSKALGLIKELTEENERLRGQKDVRDILVKDLSSRNKELQRANEALGKYAENLETELYECINIKADTVKKMQSEIEKRCIKGGIYPAFVKSTIDQIAKEMFLVRTQLSLPTRRKGNENLD